MRQEKKNIKRKILKLRSWHIQWPVSKFSEKKSFVGSFRLVGGREQNSGRRKDWASDWDGLWQCQLWSGPPARMMGEYEGSSEEERREGRVGARSKSRRSFSKWLVETVWGPRISIWKICAGRLICVSAQILQIKLSLCHTLCLCSD